jgi:acetylornithine deacetylase/succinyl-diaminopimelate desuccinylase-like protein
MDSDGEALALLRDYVRIRSVNPRFQGGGQGEAAMADRVQADLRAVGLEVERLEVEPGRPNLIATLRGTGGGPRLLFNAHLDTVPARDGEDWIDPETGSTLTRWTVDPFAGEVRGGMLVARGAADHKLPLAALVVALRRLRAQGWRPRGDLLIICDADEETGGAAGMRHIARTRDLAVDAALYGCTTDFTELAQGYVPALGRHNVIRALSGSDRYCLHLAGESYHSLTPRDGRNAIEAFMAVAPLLERWAAAVNAEVNPVVGRGKPRARVVNVRTDLRAAHRAAEVCEVDITRRIDPGEDADAAFAELAALVAPHRLERTAHLPWHETPAEPAGTDAGGRAWMGWAAAAACLAVSEEPARVTGLPAPVGLSQLLAERPMPAVLFAFGSVNYHHALDERVPVAAAGMTARAYAQILRGYLGSAGV